MYLTKKHLPRRTFLRGMGVTLALPFLESMVPARTMLAQTAANPARRLGFVYVPHGAIMSRWTPAEEGAGFDFTPILTPLEPFRRHVNVVSGLVAAVGLVVQLTVDSFHVVSSTPYTPRVSLSA